MNNPNAKKPNKKGEKFKTTLMNKNRFLDLSPILNSHNITIKPLQSAMDVQTPMNQQEESSTPTISKLSIWFHIPFKTIPNATKPTGQPSTSAKEQS